ncbi:class I SAM-dependent methyltransferase [Anaerolentibacter hominis]|uniref:class I SAM-dependent methyltransferase n=1 Tax=Anaerolentibacter hominis TaxID=3079009 RepID=UPI0031B89B13
MSERNNKILGYMRRMPELYEASSSPFWDDSHISGQMLKAHLDPEFDGASRNYHFIRRSVDWIAEYCGGKKKKLLDLGCGPGLYAELLSEKGFTVTGIDFSRRSIDYASKHAAAEEKEIQYHCRNYLDLEYKEEFDIILLIYCDFGVLPPSDRAVLLRRIERALTKGGIFILDGFTEQWLKNFEEKNKAEYQENGFWSEKPCVVIQRNEYYRETENTLEQYIVMTDEECNCFNLWNQIYSKETFTAELRKAGFQDIEVFGDVAGTAYTGEGDTLCLAARKRS